MLENVQLLSPLALTALHWVFIIPICILSVFLTLLILVQRGRGGGLTGALGGMGGQSAFGAKAGDLFTKITIITAMIWILLSMGALKVLHVGKFGNNVASPPPATVPAGTNTVDPLNPKPTGLTPETAPAKTGDAPKTNDAAPSSTPAPAPPAPAEPPAAPSAPAPVAPAPAAPEKSDDSEKK